MLFYLLFCIKFSKLTINSNNFFIFHICSACSMNIITIVVDELSMVTYSLAVFASIARYMAAEIDIVTNQSRHITFLMLNGYFCIDWNDVIPSIDKNSRIDSKIFIFESSYGLQKMNARISL